MPSDLKPISSKTESAVTATTSAFQPSGSVFGGLGVTAFVLGEKLIKRFGGFER